MSSTPEGICATDIAVIGISFRFPGARSCDELWHDLANGVESIKVYSDEELLASGVVTRADLADPSFVRSSAIVGDVDLLDAQFFGFAPREAELIDPQHRLFLECAWEVLEDAGYAPSTFDGAIGVFGGAGEREHSYQHGCLYPNKTLVQSVGIFPIMLGNTREFMPTRVSYKLNLRGPSINVQTACSTSLVAVHLAGQSLLSGECNLALAGGVTICVPEITGYTYREGMITSPDGHCRAFDARARGTVWGNGIGIVCLKRASDAIADGDRIRAIIKGSAVNNDGSAKVGYTAPSIEGQAAVILEAQAMARCHPDTVTYVEAHGTATALGDPVEIAALTQAFRANTERSGFCAVGSIKTNIGHLDTAAGIAGLVKTVLSLEHRQIPPSLHYRRPNPQIDFARTPFFVNTKLTDWASPDGPRRAGVSSFGIGGTNAHAIVEEAPEPEPSGPSRQTQLLVLSAQTAAALDAASTRLAEHLEAHPELPLADTAFTLALGRTVFAHRRAVVCRDAQEASQRLRGRAPPDVASGVTELSRRPVIFMFSGQGAQYVDMGKALYEREAVFRDEVDRAAAILRAHLDLDLRRVIYPDADHREEAAERLQQTAFTQVALFTVEHALARLWSSWGVQPEAMIGHSLGEYVAATLAGVFSLEDALGLVAERGRLMQSMPAGSMLAVPLPAEAIEPLLGPALSLAAINGPSFCVVSGETEAVRAMERRLAAQGVACTALRTSHAFHSRMMEPIAGRFRDRLDRVRMAPPATPFASNVTGRLITAQEATDPAYWVRHLRAPVRFADGLAALLPDAERALLEVGPGQTLALLAERHPAARSVPVSTSLRHPRVERCDQAFILASLGRLWLNGAKVAWRGLFEGQRRRRIGLPTYAFERKRYWIDPEPRGAEPEVAGAPLQQSARVEEWFYVPSWQRAPLLEAPPTLAEGHAVVLFADGCGLALGLAEVLRARGHAVTLVSAGEAFERRGPDAFTIRPDAARDHHELVAALELGAPRRTTLVHAFSVGEASERAALDRGFFSLMHLMAALGSGGTTEGIDLLVLSTGVHDVSGTEPLQPAKATLLGAVRTIPSEYPDLAGCRAVDVVLDASGAIAASTVAQILTEIALGASGKAGDRVVALRGIHRSREAWESLRLAATERPPVLRDRGVYLITGGLGGIGMELAAFLAEQAQARLVLTGRTAFLPRDAWGRWLAEHGDRDLTGARIRRIQALEAGGAEIEILEADVTDRARMEAVFAHARRRFGRLDGIVHAAGVPGGGALQWKTPAEVERVFGPKIDGARVLDELVGDAPLDFMVLCSSLTSVLGGFGQSDYCAANAYLDAFALRRAGRRPGLTLSLGWGAWQQVGMAAAAARASVVGELAEPEMEAFTHPLFTRRSSGDAGELVFAADLAVSRHWFLEEHRVMGKATLPGTAYVEMVRAAFEVATGAATSEIRDLYFLAPLEVGESAPLEARVTLRRRDDGFAFGVSSGDVAGGWREHARGEAHPYHPAEPGVLPLEAIEATCPEGRAGAAHGQDPSIGMIQFGPRWQNLEGVHLGEGRCLAELRLPERFVADLDGYRVHPALLDGATSVLTRAKADNLLPFAYARIRIGGALPAVIRSYVRELPKAGGADKTLRYDVTITDAAGRILIEIEEYTLVKLDLVRLSALQAEPKAAPAAAAGLTRSEGVETFRRALASGQPQILVSSWDLPRLILQQAKSGLPVLSELASEASGPKAAHRRPEIATEFIAPGTDVERRVAAVWAEVLGVEPIGIHDNFFELGGNSLVGAQVVLRLGQAFEARITPVMLYEDPTVAALARALAPEGEADEGLDESLARGQQRRERRKSRKA